MELPEENSDARAVLAADGGRLFVERAHDSRPDFELTEKRARVISRLLRRVGGIPASIQKTADMMKDRQPAEVLDALGSEMAQVAMQVGSTAASKGKEILARVRESSEFAAVLQSLGSVAADRRELAEAERTSRQALAIYERLGDREGVVACLRQLGTIALRQSDLQRAVTLLSAAYDAAQEAQSPQAPAILADLEALRHATGRLPQVQRMGLDQAVRLAMSD